MWAVGSLKINAKKYVQTVKGKFEVSLCHLKTKILHTCFSMKYMCIYSSKPKNYSYMCQTLYLNSWLQPSYPKYEIHFKMLQSKSWGLTYIHVTHFLLHVYIHDCLDLWLIILIVEQLWVKYSITKQTETVSDSNKGVIVGGKFIIFQCWLAIYMYMYI